MNIKYITRFTYTYTNFQGWRVAIRRQGYTLTRYFSDRQYEDSEVAYEHALQFRDMVLRELEANPGDELNILMKHRAQPKFLYPAGLKPNSTPDKVPAADNVPEHSACSMRSNKVMQGVLKDLCNKLQLDTASVLKLSLYLFSMQFSCAAATDKHLHYAHTYPKQVLISHHGDTGDSLNLHRLIDELEKVGMPAGLPSFEEFSTGHCNTKVVIQHPEPTPVAEEISPQPHILLSRMDRASINYFNHFYNSQRTGVSTPISPRVFESELHELSTLHHPNP